MNCLRLSPLLAKCSVETIKWSMKERGRGAVPSVRWRCENPVKRLVQVGIEQIVAKGEQVARIAVDEQRRWNQTDAIQNKRVGLKALAVEDLRPLHPMLLKKRGERGRLTRTVHADAQDLKPTAVILLVCLHHEGVLVGAVGAPGGPEVEDHFLALIVLREADRLTVHGRRGERESGLTDVQNHRR